MQAAVIPGIPIRSLLSSLVISNSLAILLGARSAVGLEGSDLHVGEDKRTLTLISGSPPRILRHEARLCGSFLLQARQASPRCSVDNIWFDAPPWTSYLVLVSPDGSSGAVAHGDVSTGRSAHLLVRRDRAPRALVQAFCGDRPTRAPLRAAIYHLHVGDASARTPRRVRDQRVPGAATGSRIPVLGHQRRPGAVQGDQAVPRASTHRATGHQ